MVGFLRISVSGLASDFLEESAGWMETETKVKFWLLVKWMKQLKVCYNVLSHCTELDNERDKLNNSKILFCVC